MTKRHAAFPPELRYPRGSGGDSKLCPRGSAAAVPTASRPTVARLFVAGPRTVILKRRRKWHVKEHSKLDEFGNRAS